MCVRVGVYICVGVYIRVGVCVCVHVCACRCASRCLSGEQRDSSGRDCGPAQHLQEGRRARCLQHAENGQSCWRRTQFQNIVWIYVPTLVKRKNTTKWLRSSTQHQKILKSHKKLLKMIFKMHLASCKVCNKHTNYCNSISIFIMLE